MANKPKKLDFLCIKRLSFGIKKSIKMGTKKMVSKRQTYGTQWQLNLKTRLPEYKKSLFWYNKKSLKVGTKNDPNGKQMLPAVANKPKMSTFLLQKGCDMKQKIT